MPISIKPTQFHVRTDDGYDSAPTLVQTSGAEGQGVSDDLKQALLQLAQKTAYIDDQGAVYYKALYRCVQGHTSQTGWEPDKTPALWTEVAKPGEIPVWRQPTGAQDAYNTGDKVHYPDADGPVYVSTVNDNVWVPGVYGWDLV